MKIRTLIIASILLMSLVAAVSGGAQRIPDNPGLRETATNVTAIPVQWDCQAHIAGSESSGDWQSGGPWNHRSFTGCRSGTPSHHARRSPENLHLPRQMEREWMLRLVHRPCSNNEVSGKSSARGWLYDTRAG